ncbi:MAG: TRAP transporter small permease [Candidatus Tectomicrobia bacterium]|nr:TRAP transporter small permease [Candidatus Tectomicrobia bacterium]
MESVFTRVDLLIRRITAGLVILLMAAMTAATLLGVLYRYVLNEALPWPEELARYAMVWVACLGSSLALRYGDHVAVEFIAQRMPPAARHRVLFGGRLLILVFLVMMVVFGADMTRQVSHQQSAALEISMSVPNLAIPVGGLLMIYHLLVLMVRREGEAPRPPDLPTA